MNSGIKNINDIISVTKWKEFKYRTVDGRYAFSDRRNL